MCSVILILNISNATSAHLSYYINIFYLFRLSPLEYGLFHPFTTGYGQLSYHKRFHVVFTIKPRKQIIKQALKSASTRI